MNVRSGIRIPSHMKPLMNTSIDFGAVFITHKGEKLMIVKLQRYGLNSNGESIGILNLETNVVMHDMASDAFHKIDDIKTYNDARNVIYEATGTAVVDVRLPQDVKVEIN